MSTTVSPSIAMAAPTSSPSPDGLPERVRDLVETDVAVTLDRIVHLIVMRRACFVA
jgi:hypothetical protein